MDFGDKQINRPNFKSHLGYSLKLEMSLKLPWLITQELTAPCLASKYSMTIPSHPLSPSSLKAQGFPKMSGLRTSGNCFSKE